MSARVASATILLASSVACDLTDAPSFGRKCSDGCDLGFTCDPARNLCLPPPAPQPPDLRGRSCAEPMPLPAAVGAGRVDAAFVLTEQNTAARVLTHADGVAFHVRAHIDASEDVVVRARLTAPFPVQLVWADTGACDTADRYNVTTTATELVLPRAAPGDHDLIIVTPALPVDVEARVTLAIEQVECPAGFLPEGDACVGFIEVTDLEPRVDHTLEVAPDMRAFATGGHGDDGAALAVVDILDLRTFDVTSVRSDWARANHGSTVLFDGTVLHVGGLTDGDPPLLVFERGEIEPIEIQDYLHDTGFDDALGCIAAPLLAPDAVFVICDGIAPGKFGVKETSEGRLCSSQLDCASDGLVCVALIEGESEIYPGRCACLGGACTGNPLVRGQWADGTSNAPADLWRHGGFAASIPLPTGVVVLLAGGVTDAGAPATAYVNLDGDEYLHAADELVDGLTPRLYGRAVTRGDAVVIVDGVSLPDGAPLAVADIARPTQLSGSVAHVPLQRPRTRAAVAALDDTRVLVGGGSDGDVPLASTEIIDVVAGTSERGPELPRATIDARGGGTAGVVAIGGGRDADGALIGSMFVLVHIAPTRARDALVISGRIETDTCFRTGTLVGTSGSLTASTVGFHDDFEGGTCVEDDARSPDAVYAVEVPANRAFTATLSTPQYSDIVLTAFDTCGAEVACIAFADEYFEQESPAEAERMTVPPAPVARTLFIVVDAFGRYEAGVQGYEPGPFEYELTWEIHQ